MIETRQRRAWADQAQQGDPLAVAGLLATHYPLLRSRTEARMGAALKARFEPEDVLQEVYVDVFRQIGRFRERGPESFLNWVLTILDSKLVDAHRALHRRKRDFAREVGPQVAGGSGSSWNLVDELYADSGTPSRAARRGEAIAALMTCVSRLSDLHRQVIQLRFLEGRSVAEAAERLAKSPAVIVALTRSALKNLRESMDRLGEFSRGT